MVGGRGPTGGGSQTSERMGDEVPRGHYAMGGRGATGVGQNKWEHGRQGWAASGYLAKVKHERGEGREWAHLEFEMVILRPRLSIPLVRRSRASHARLQRRVWLVAGDGGG